MLNTILSLIRALFLILGGHEQLALENLALREQLGIFQRNVPRALGWHMMHVISPRQRPSGTNSATLN